MRLRDIVAGAAHGVSWPVLLMLAVLAPARAAGESGPSEEDFAAVVTRAVDAHIRPAQAEFAIRAQRLQALTERLCEAPSKPHLMDARAGFRVAVAAFSALEPIRAGPLAEDNKRERLAFWPDARGRGLAQVQRLVAGKDVAVLDPKSLAGKSVAVQGLPAFEFLLFGSGADTVLESNSFRCRYAAAIAANTRQIADEMVVAWAPDGPATTLFERPGPDNPMFLTHAEAAGELVAGMATALEILADQKLRAILGAEPNSAKPKLGPWWRSGETFPAMASTLESTRNLFEVSGIADLLPDDREWLGRSILFEFGSAIKVAQSLRQPVEQLVVAPAGRGSANYLSIVTGSLKANIGRELTAAVGLEQGFNSLDGD